MSFGSSFQIFDLTIWSDLAHNLANLLLLVLGEAKAIKHAFAAAQIQCLELSLPGEDGKQGTHALIATAKPKNLPRDVQVLQGVELGIGEGLQEVNAN